MKALAIAATLALCAVAPARAQLASSFSHGPTIPFVVVEQDSAGDWTANMLAAGAAYSLRWNFLPNMDGTVRWLGLEVPFFLQLPDAGEFRYGMGLAATAYNGLIGFGAVCNVIDTRTQSGLAVGRFSTRDVALVVRFGFNFGSGSPAPTTMAAKALQSTGPVPHTNAPPCYVSF